MTTIKLRRSTAAEWTSANPILAAGEMGIETDTRKFKFGDGATPWNTLAYASAEGGGGTGDVTAAGDNYFTGNNTFTGTTKFDNDVNIHGANLEVAGALKAATGNITNLQVPNTLTSSGEINAVSIKSTGIRSDDIQTTTNKKYLTEVDVDNQTIQVVDGKLHANLDTKQNILSDGNGTKIVDNKVDIYQGTAGINGLNLYQNNGTITKNNDLSIAFNNGACGYIYFPNKGVNNNYEIVLHCAYNNRRGSREDSDIHGIRVEPTTNFPNGETYLGFSWVDVWSSPFRAIIVNKDSTRDYSATIPTVNYIKYTIIGTKIRQYYSTDGVDYTSITYNNSLDYVEISETGAYLNLCISNRNFPTDINDCWTNTTLFPDSYVLDKTTNTYLMKQGIANEGVAVATSSKYGLVLPDNSTIVSNNGVLSSITPNNVVTTDTQQNITNSKKFYNSQWFYNTLYTKQGITSFRGNENITLANLIKHTDAVYVGDNSYETVIQGSTKIKLDATTLTHELDDSTEATIVDSSNVSTYATGLAFPSNRYINLTPGANGASYIAPADGWIAFAKKLTATGQFVSLSNNTTYMSTMGCNASDGSGGNTSCFIPCKKGDEVVTYYSAGGDVLTLRFIYAEGVQ